MKVFVVVEFDKVTNAFGDGTVVPTHNDAEWWAAQRDGNCTIQELDVPVAQKRYSEGP